jgi:hypothetical protein
MACVRHISHYLQQVFHNSIIFMPGCYSQNFYFHIQYLTTFKYSIIHSGIVFMVLFLVRNVT